MELYKLRHVLFDEMQNPLFINDPITSESPPEKAHTFFLFSLLQNSCRILLSAAQLALVQPYPSIRHLLPPLSSKIATWTPSSPTLVFLESSNALGVDTVNSHLASLHSDLNVITPHASSSNHHASNSLFYSMWYVQHETPPSQIHSMTTWSMNNIFKPKQHHTISKHSIPLSLELTCVSQVALSHTVSHP